VGVGWVSEDLEFVAEELREALELRFPAPPRSPAYCRSANGSNAGSGSGGGGAWSRPAHHAIKGPVVGEYVVYTSPQSETRRPKPEKWV
jgi:hypothetical protein